MSKKTRYCSQCGRVSDRGCIQICRACSGLARKRNEIRPVTEALVQFLQTKKRKAEDGPHE